MVRSVLLNLRRARWTACSIVMTTMVHPAQSQQAKPAEPNVAAANRAVQSRLPFSDRQAFEDGMRGFIATTPDAANPDRYGFLKHEAPPTVNPSLWRQAQLNAVHGLFKVADGVYQVRGFLQANMTIVEGSTGLIIIDTLSTPGAAREALALYFAHRPRKPVVAVIYSHSHGDHYGGVSGVVSQADVAAGKANIIAPAGFMEAVVGEAVIGGNAKARRAQYQFGGPLPLGERGNVDEGLGKNDSRGASGAGSIIAPNDTIQSVPGVSAEMLRAMPIALVFDYLGTRVDGPRAGTANIVINWQFTDTRESLASPLSHAALTSITAKPAANPVVPA